MTRRFEQPFCERFFFGFFCFPCLLAEGTG
jgi:hypothetical protein